MQQPAVSHEQAGTFEIRTDKNKTNSSSNPTVMDLRQNIQSRRSHIDLKHHELNQLMEERSICTHGSSFCHFISIKNHIIDGLTTSAI